jgi:hypothetical protein
VDLTLRDGIHLQDAIINAKQINEQSKAAGFYQEALDHVARQGYGNASFEVGGEEGLDIIEEFYNDYQNTVEVQPDSASSYQTVESAMQVQQGLRQSVRAVN